MKLLHVLNGDATRVPLEASTTPGDFAVWADALHEGPVPADLSDDELRDLRIRHFAARFGIDETELSTMVHGWEAPLARWAEYDEVVFWFEHDLFDQLLLIRHLAWIATLGESPGRFSLICIDEHPELPHFNGLGQLSADQLSRLFPTREPLTAQEIEVGERAWRLFRADDPTELVRWIATAEAGVLPFLPGALARHLEEFPAVTDGMSRSERQILRAIGPGVATFGDLFRKTQRMEQRVYMGDTIFAGILRDLARARVPLLTEREKRYALAPAGRDVLAGRADHVVLNGIDRWLGGVHLTSESCWRLTQIATTPNFTLQISKTPNSA